MSRNISRNISQIQHSPRSLIYIPKIIREKGRNRIRLSPIYEEAARRFIIEDIEDKELIATVRKLDPVKVPLPYHLVRFLKDAIFKHKIKQNDLAFEIAFIGYEYLNVILHLLGLGSISIMHYNPEEFDVEREKVAITDEGLIDKVIVRAAGFTIYPFRKPTQAIEFYGVFYDVRDEIDYGTFSDGGFTVDLYKLMKEHNLRWDIDTRY